MEKEDLLVICCYLGSVLDLKRDSVLLSTNLTWQVCRRTILFRTCFVFLEFMLNWIYDICRVQVIRDSMVYVGAYSNKIEEKVKLALELQLPFPTTI